jgi:hypothetical protein
MGLKIIGSGFGRTGTMSLKRALEQLAFGPCHHMEELIMHPEEYRHYREFSALLDRSAQATAVCRRAPRLELRARFVASIIHQLDNAIFSGASPTCAQIVALKKIRFMLARKPCFRQFY